MALDINEMNAVFVVEWNRKQKHFQIQTLGEILKSNLLAAVNRRASGCDRTHRERSPRNHKAYRGKAKEIEPGSSGR
jgi:hypothetical protein